MSPSPPRLLDFAVLDDLLMALEMGLCPTELPRLVPRRIGPLLELAIFAVSVRSGDVSELLVPSKERRAFESLLREPVCGGATLSPTPKSLELARIPLGGEALMPHWVAFRRRLQSAALKAGLATRVAAGLAGAFSELSENVLIHGERPDTGLCGYQFEQGRFEFVVADAGIGVLNSLKKCRDYGHLCDSGMALQTALADGESRFGRASGRGLGYHQLFASLANQKGDLRFRSGDHSLELNETSPSLIHAQIAQRAMLQGLVATVACQS